MSKTLFNGLQVAGLRLTAPDQLAPNQRLNQGHHHAVKQANQA
jgi:hypothetical protein